MIKKEKSTSSEVQLKQEKKKQENKEMDFTVSDYKVVRIDGDYAHLQRIDQPETDFKLEARAILPAEIVEGSTLHYEMLQYELIG